MGTFESVSEDFSFLSFFPTFFAPIGLHLVMSFFIQLAISHCIVLYCSVVQCSAVQCVALQCVALRCVALCCVVLHCIFI